MHDEVDIPFPFTPYPPQKALMQELYKALEEGKIGLFESPTGTGKSLSMICASLTWLRHRSTRDLQLEPQTNHENHQHTANINQPQTKKASASTITSSSKASIEEPDWLRDYTTNKEEEKARQRLEVMRARQQKLQEKFSEARRTKITGTLLAKTKREGTAGSGSGGGQQPKGGDDSLGGVQMEGEGEDADLLLGDYESDREEWQGRDKEFRWDSSSDSEAEGRRAEEEEDRNKELDLSFRKILYCSRTHSQVSQFVNEIRKTAFRDDVRVISLSARKNLCINEDVLRLGSDTRINDRCLDMQKGKKKNTPTTTSTPTTSIAAAQVVPPKAKKARVAPRRRKSAITKCPYLESSSSRSLQGLYRDQALSSINDLEDLVKLGTKLGTCPYYGSRHAIAQAEVIAMPYTVLLQKDSREALGIPLKGNVVLVDEAHNLIDALNAAHTHYVTLAQVERALSQTTLYRNRYADRLSAKNLLYVDQIVAILKALASYLQTPPPALDKSHDSQAPRAKVVSVNTFLFDAGIDHMNLFKIQRYMEVSQIAKKVLGFADRRLTEVQQHPMPSSSSSSGSTTTNQGEVEGDASSIYISTHVSSLQMLQGFLTALTGADRDGRIVVDWGVNNNSTESSSTGNSSGKAASSSGRSMPSLKFMLLNPSLPFREVVDQAHAVVLLGGTMQPVSQFIAQLLPQVDPCRIHTFTCGHVIPPENLLPLCVPKGPTGVTFDFTHKSRSLACQLDELGRLLVNVCTVVPGGVVCFLPSYGYEEQVFRHWQSTGQLSRLQQKKPVFREPRGAKDVDTLLQAYAHAIASSSNMSTTTTTTTRGAVLFCVVGAKMSEGINFSDDLCRCVVMVGLPYPDARDPEIQQKMKYIDDLADSNKGKKLPGGALTGRGYYQNLCMRAVNQSIGRAIRHAQDYATILLVDHRYQSDPSLVPLLPQWISQRIPPSDQAMAFGKVFGHLTQFFRSRCTTSSSSTN